MTGNYGESQGEWYTENGLEPSLGPYRGALDFSKKDSCSERLVPQMSEITYDIKCTTCNILAGFVFP